MVILGIESSAVSASAAIVNNGKLTAEMFLNAGLTHSVTLLPLVKSALETAGLDISQIDAVAVANGPGSFTGIRIGVATAKGLAQPQNKPCVPVSTLEAIAYPLKWSDCIAVAVMDARCNQVYTAAFDCFDGNIKRISDDEAISICELNERIKTYDKKVVLIGDGSDVVFGAIGNQNISKASEYIKHQRASSVAFIAAEKLNLNENIVSANELVPTYLRLSQAERELKKKK